MQNDIARRAYIVTVLCVGPDKLEQVRTGVKYYFFFLFFFCYQVSIQNKFGAGWVGVTKNLHIDDNLVVFNVVVFKY